MKTIHLIIVFVAALSLILLSGCGKDGDGQLDVKEPMKELSELPPRINWTINGPVDESGNPIDIGEVE